MDKVVHFEIPYDDKSRAMKFYGETFGWDIKDLGPQMGDYVLAQTADTDSNRMVQDKGAINGGMSKRDAKNSVPRVFIQVDSIEESSKKIEAAGGKVVTQPMPIPNGRMAIFTDTEGNSVGLTDSVKTQMSEDMMKNLQKNDPEMSSGVLVSLGLPLHKLQNLQELLNSVQHHS